MVTLIKVCMPATALVMLLAGCSSKEAILPAGDSTMMDLWQHRSGSVPQGMQAREAPRRPLTGLEQRGEQSQAESYSRTQESEISQQFPRLPNPDMVMYVYPHLANGRAPVPGYSTVFSFYSSPQYALPGERTEAL
ncbi:TIGR03751 family conjugal transfer lipoprotein [Salmonella enterica]|uniref:TIGR03751 family conjugal transfer lipoprotein n=1 Tax=Salmonella enterica I TaxID=59201 RepID=A0A403QMP3_SALET|nr:TIGR03751 family conjugal transfer lipoprotein [Salmonella enterica]EBQ9002624.1 TIGR03751 family conjugal transfer lipoprotein [Salmonella enterica subsp. enterica serovar Blockley]EBS0795399.1 TIGR03751 family conjugal transfer lipoprotein [Salmonella enterica subsp. enterica serovar Overschie]EBZ5139075.1 TIGR03751 family conjugal transfer lipoprotein [Salmonella enterica subsp. enterica serovar Antsalova]ECD5540212.1 TIGR03751 family conjugal transfer lipoprotein [Salmonella enterica sub